MDVEVDGELALSLACWAVAQTREECPPSLPNPSPSMAGGRAGPRVVGVGKLAMFLTGRPYTSTGQGRADSGFRGEVGTIAGELALRA